MKNAYQLYFSFQLVFPSSLFSVIPSQMFQGRFPTSEMGRTGIFLPVSRSFLTLFFLSQQRSGGPSQQNWSKTLTLVPKPRWSQQTSTKCTDNGSHHGLRWTSGQAANCLQQGSSSIQLLFWKHWNTEVNSAFSITVLVLALATSVFRSSDRNVSWQLTCFPCLIFQQTEFKSYFNWSGCNTVPLFLFFPIQIYSWEWQSNFCFVPFFLLSQMDFLGC